jgi:hypothetical protein
VRDINGDGLLQLGEIHLGADIIVLACAGNRGAAVLGELPGGGWWSGRRACPPPMACY